MAAQLLLTFLMSLFASGIQVGEEFFKRPNVAGFGLILMLTSSLVLLLSEQARRSVPWNYIWLFAATIGEASLISSVSAFLTMTSVLTCILATCLVTGGLFVAAWFTSTSVNKKRLIRNFALSIFGAMLLQSILL